MKQSSKTIDSRRQDRPENPIELKIPTGIRGDGIWAWVSMTRHDDPKNPFKVTSRTRLPLREIAKDGRTALLGKLPLSEYKTVPHHDHDRAAIGETNRHFFSQVEITLCVPNNVDCMVHQKKFYGPRQGMHEVRGFSPQGENFTLYSRCFPYEHKGLTAHSGIETDENRNNLYLSLCKEDSFQTWSAAVVVDPIMGAMLVLSKPYEGDVFKTPEGVVECPFLRAESSVGKTGVMLMPMLQHVFKDAPLPHRPDGYMCEVPMNLDCLRRGVTPGASGVEWAQAYVDKDSGPRNLSFGVIKGVGEKEGEAQFVYINWFELPDNGKMRRVPVGTIVHGTLESDGNGRQLLKNLRFLPSAEMREKVKLITSTEVIMKKGAYTIPPEWLQKVATRAGETTTLGHAFAEQFDKMRVAIQAA